MIYCLFNYIYSGHVFICMFLLLYLISYTNISTIKLAGFTVIVARMLNNSRNSNCVLVIFLVGQFIPTILP